MDHLTLSLTLIVCCCGIYLVEWTSMKRKKKQQQQQEPTKHVTPDDISTVPILFVGGPLNGASATCMSKEIFRHSRPRIRLMLNTEYECGPLRGDEHCLIMTFRHPKLEQQQYVTVPVPEPN